MKCGSLTIFEALEIFTSFFFCFQKIDGKALLRLLKEDILDITGGKVGPSLKIFDLVQQLKIKVNPSQSRHLKNSVKKML